VASKTRFFHISLFIIFLPVISSCSRHIQKVYFIQNAELAGSKYLKENPILNGHEIVKGSGNVIAVRIWDEGAKLTIDDESFHKITFQIPDFKESLKIQPSSRGTKLFYSGGGSAFVSGKSGKILKDYTGAISLQKKDGKIILNADIEIARTDLLWGPEDKNIKIVLKNVQVIEMKFEELTPWIGKSLETDDMYMFSYPSKKDF
jgi:hypothetical protein